MPAPIIAAGVGAVGAIGGAVLGGKAQKSAAKAAASAETQAAQANIAATREFYNRNTANLSPWMQSGTRANALVDSFLYGPAPSSYYPQEQAVQQAPSQQAPQPAPMNIMEESSGLRQMLPYWKAPDGAEPQMNALLPSSQPAPGQVTTTQAQPALQQPGGYQAFVNSPYYQFGLNEGMRSLNHGLASRGMLESGDAMKRAIRYGQDYGYGRMNEFIGLAENQSNRGLTAGSALAGVSTNALNSTNRANTAIGEAAAARATMGGIANSQMYGTIGNSLGQFANTVFAPRSSYAPIAGGSSTQAVMGFPSVRY